MVSSVCTAHLPSPSTGFRANPNKNYQRQYQNNKNAEKLNSLDV